MLLNQPDSTTVSTATSSSTNATSATAMQKKPNQLHLDHHLNHNQTSALFVAAQNGHTDCVMLLLSSGFPADVLDDAGFTPLHFAAANGHRSCMEVLLAAGAAVDAAAADGQTSLLLACEAGRLDCVQMLLKAGAKCSLTTVDGCTVLHAAVRSGHVDTLRLLLRHPAGDAATDPPTSALLNQANSDGWTAAHTAAALGLKECLAVLCSHREQDIGRRDNWNRSIHDVATDDCKDLLENLHSYQIPVLLQCSRGGLGSMCPMVVLDEDEEGVSSSQMVLGRVTVDRGMDWTRLNAAVSQVFTSHLQILVGESPAAPEEAQHAALGLGVASIASIVIGDAEWFPGQELPLSPWFLVQKPLSQSITIRLKGLDESCLDELARESLLPLPFLQNCVRLVERYGNLFVHGPEGSCQEYIADLVARCIKSKQEAVGIGCEVVRVEVEESLTKEQLLHSFIDCGFLVPAAGSGPEPWSGPAGHCVVLLLEGLEKAASLSGLLGDLCQSLGDRDSPLVLSAGPHRFSENNFLIASLSKPRLQGSELRLQQHFRWMSLRWDQEPLHGLLGRHLRRKLLCKVGLAAWSADGVMERAVSWTSRVWQQLNACLSRLGAHEALLGPQLFLSCPVVPDNTPATVRWLARLWNAVVVPRVEEAIVSRVTATRPFSALHSPPPSQRPSPSNRSLSAGQRAVVKAALSILVNKAILPGCPLPRRELDRHLLEFRGSALPLAAIGSCTGSGGGGGRWGRDGVKVRRSNTSPRKKGSGEMSRSCGGSFGGGSLSSCDSNFLSHRESATLQLFSDDETDLIKELQTLCSSRSEPDITKTVTSASSFPQTAMQSHERRSGPCTKSKLPVPSSRGQQTRASVTPSSSSNQVQTPPNRRRTGPDSSSNNYRNNINSQTHEDIWILHRRLHENNNK